MFWKGDLSEIERIPPPPPDDPVGLHTEEILGFKIYLCEYDEAEKIVLKDKRETFSCGGWRAHPGR